ncbi:MAG: class I SAM-dependent methyltransferase [Ignavibacteriales bacterium]|nr:class I SAM-dependent methyltransferase [Ignavibacteriales bacterium]
MRVESEADRRDVVHSISMETRVKERMTTDEAIRRAVEIFPFEGYMCTPHDKTVKGAYSNIADMARRYLQPGSAILDFGCGPCDKTAVLQLLGFHCSAYDDLQDDWHKLPGNREKILSFAKNCGIDFKEARGGMLPFEKNSFDMIMLHDVLEHLHNSPRDLLNDLLELAKPEGLLFVTVPNAVNIRKRVDVLFGRTNLPPFEGYYWYPGSWRGHVREYVMNDLVHLSEYLDLEVLELRGCDHMLEKLPMFSRPAYLLVTNLFKGWKDSWLLVARKRKGWSAKKTLPQDALAGVLRKSTRYDYTK